MFGRHDTAHDSTTGSALPAVPQSPPWTVANVLRAAREEAGLRLQDVATAIRVRAAQLRAIEDGRYQELPGTVYATGFVRAYADYLGLDVEAVTRRFKEEIAGLEQQTELVFPTPVPEGRVPGGAILMVALLIAAAAYGGWLYLESSDRRLADLAPDLPERLAELLNSAGVAPDGDAEGAASPTADRLSDDQPGGNAVTTAGTEGPAAPPGGGTADPLSPGDLAAAPDEPAAPPPRLAAIEPEAPSPYDPSTASAAEQPSNEDAAGAGFGEPAAPAAQPVAPPAPPGAAEAPPATDSLPSVAARAPADRSPSEPGSEAAVGRAAIAALDRPADAVAAPAPPTETGGRDAPATVAPATDAPATETAANDPAADDPAADDPTPRLAEEAGRADRGASATGRAIDPFPSAPADAPSATDASAAPQTDSPDATASDGSPEDAGQSPAETQVAAAAPPPPPPAASADSARQYGLVNGESRILIRAVEDSWVQVNDSNGSLIMTRVLRPGDTYQVPTDQGLELVTGNAGGLEILVDGTPTPSLGGTGVVVRDIQLDPDRLRSGTAVPN